MGLASSYSITAGMLASVGYVPNGGGAYGAYGGGGEGGGGGGDCMHGAPPGPMSVGAPFTITETHPVAVTPGGAVTIVASEGETAGNATGAAGGSPARTDETTVRARATASAALSAAVKECSKCDIDESPGGDCTIDPQFDKRVRSVSMR